MRRYLARNRPVWWLAPSPVAVDSVRRDLAHSGGAAARLEPGILTLRRAADRLGELGPDRRLPLGVAAIDALVGELVAAAERGQRADALRPLLATPGGRRYLSDSFRRLRLGGLSPQQAGAALRAENGDDAGSALARLYRDYVAALDRGRLADEAGRIEQAIAALGASRWELDGLIIDQGAPLAPLHRRFVQELAGRADWVVIAAPQPQSAAPLLRRASDRRAASWREALAGVFEASAAGPVPARRVASGLAAVRDALFDDDAPPSPDPSGVSVLGAASEQHAARLAARRVKSLLLEGAAPGDVLLAALRSETIEARLAAELSEHGVPFWSSEAPRLGAAPLVAAAIDLLAVLESDGAFDTLLALLARADLPGLAPGEPPAGFASGRAAAEWFVREAQAPSGLAGLARHAASLVDTQGGSESRDKLAHAAQAAGALFSSLDRLRESLPEEATPLAWIDALVNSVAEWMGGHANAATSDAARDALEDAAAAVEWLARWRGRRPESWRRDALLAQLREWSRRLRLPRAVSAEGRVRVVEWNVATGLPCRHLVVASAGEQAFSPPPGGEPDDAMLRFYELAATPTESLTLIYAHRDDAGQPLSPSPYVEDVERCFATGACRPSDEADRAKLSPREWRRHAAAAARGGEPAALADWTAAAGPALLRGLAAVHARATGDHFGPWEGVLGAAAAAGLREHYGPQHLWSASQLELVATCPYKFFARHVLKMAPPGELELEVNYRRRGSLIHDALAIALAAAGQAAPPGRPLSDAAAELGERLLEQLDRLGSIERAAPHQAALVAIEAHQAREWAARYARQQADFDTDKRFADLDAPLRPALLEARFGPSAADDGPEDAASVDKPLELTLPSGEPLRLTGRIDRIDVGRQGDRTLFAVIDYKTARELTSSVEKISSGKQLQPVLYALAAQRLFLSEEAIPIAAGYWGVREKGFVGPKAKELPMVDYDARDGRPRPSDDWVALVQSALERAGELVQATRHGRFPMHNDDVHCAAQCEFSTVCRVGQARALGKTPAPLFTEERAE